MPSGPDLVAPERLAPSTRSERRLVLLFSLLFVLLGLLFAVLLPMFANFDEQTHLDRARWTTHHPTDLPGPELRITYGSWAAAAQVRQGAPEVGRAGVAQRREYRAFPDYPRGDEGDPAPCPGVCQNIQFGHPPAWYLLVAPIIGVLGHRPFPLSVMALRAFDVLLAAPLVALAWITAREVWPRSRRRPILVAACVALMAPLAYTASGVNNDGLMLLTIGAAVAVAAHILRVGATWRSGLLLGAVVGLGLLTKVEMVLVAPALGLCVLAAPSRRRDRILASAAFAVTALPATSWWFWFQRISDGGPLSPKSSELLGPPVPGPWSHTWYPVYAAKKLPTLIARFWGTYSEPVSFLSVPVRYSLSILAVLLGLAWLACRRWSRPRWSDLRWWLLAAVPGALAMGTLYASFDAYLRNGEVRGLAPRYVYAAAAVLAIGAVAALAAVARRVVPERHHGTLAGAGVLVLGASAVASVVKGVTNSYGTGSLSELRHRAPAVAPIGKPAPVAAVLALLWAVGLVVAAVAVARTGRDERAPATDPAGAGADEPLSPGSPAAR